MALIGITWLALAPSPATTGVGWDKANHALAFLTLGLLSFGSQTRREWLGWLGLAFYGLTLELLQWHGGFRFFEYWDLAANLLGLLFCILLRPILLTLPIVRAMKASGDTP